MIPITCNAVGDILALATLVLDIARALNEARGSPSEYRALVSELNSLNIVLSSVARVAELTSDTNLRREIVKEADRCSQDIQRALDRVAKFSSLGQASRPGASLRVKLGRQWCKLEWRFGQRGSAEEIRTELARTTQRLSAYLAISNVDGVNELRTSITNQFNSMTADICATMLEHYAAIATLSRAVDANTRALSELTTISRRDRSVSNGSPDDMTGNVDSSKAVVIALLCVAICTAHETSRVAHTALLFAAVYILMRGTTSQERSFSHAIEYTQSNSITLHDALGRTLILPLELCATKEVLHTTLASLFSKTNGRWSIDSRKYAFLTTGEYYNSYRITTWDLKSFPLQPGMELDMAVTIRSSYGTHMGISSCPVCSRTDPYHLQARLLRCTTCGTMVHRTAISVTELPGSAFNSTEVRVNTKTLLGDLGRFPRASRAAAASSTQLGVADEPIHDLDDAPSSTNLGPRVIQSEGTIDAPSLSVQPWNAQVSNFRRVLLVEDEIRNEIEPVGSFGLLTAAENGHYSLADALLDQGVDVDAAGDRFEHLLGGFTALHFASYHGHIGIVQLLLDRGATIDAIATYQEGGEMVTPLACAVSARHHDVVALLLEKGAIVDAPRPLQACVLWEATKVDDIDIARMLLRLGLDVNTRMAYDRPTENHGGTALHNAAQFGGIEMVELLLDHRADVFARSMDMFGIFPKRPESTPISIAAKRGRIDIFRLLYDRGCQNVHDASLTSVLDKKGRAHLLYSAISGNNLEIVHLVFQMIGIDVDAPTGDGDTPLSVALNRALPSSSDSESIGAKYLLFHAVFGGNPVLVELVLHITGLDVNAHLSDGYEEPLASDCDTPLSLASLCHCEQVVKLLLQRDADPNAEISLAGERWQRTIHEVDQIVTETAWTAFHVAVFSGNTTIVEMFLEHGANVHARTKYGHTPLSVAYKATQGEVSPWLTHWRPSGSRPEYDKVIKMLLARGATQPPPRPSSVIGQREEAGFLVDESDFWDSDGADCDVPGSWPSE